MCSRKGEVYQSRPVGEPSQPKGGGGVGGHREDGGEGRCGESLQGEMGGGEKKDTSRGSVEVGQGRGGPQKRGQPKKIEKEISLNTQRGGEGEGKDIHTEEGGGGGASKSLAKSKRKGLKTGSSRKNVLEIPQNQRGAKVEKS